MWLFTRYGFFSAVCARKGGKSAKAEALDPNKIMVRARNKEHLMRLKARFNKAIGTYPIRETHDTDYAYRMIVPKAAWSKVARDLAEETDYGNFKDEVTRTQPCSGSAYLHALHRVWSVMYATQDRDTLGLRQLSRYDEADVARYYQDDEAS